MLLRLPIDFLKFWYIDAPLGIITYFSSFNRAFLQLFSLPLFIKTFFKPLKNEYRKGLVGFSIGMGIVIKTGLIFVDVLLFFLMISSECFFTVCFLALPIATIWLLFV